MGAANFIACPIRLWAIPVPAGNVFLFVDVLSSSNAAIPNMSALQEILVRIRALFDESRAAGSLLWYRSHGQADWKLRSLLHRFVADLLSYLEKPLLASV